MNNNLRIVFMGTPGFSVGILEAIKNAGLNICGIVTVADKPAGRGQVMHESPVKQFAIQNNIALLQPVKLKDEQFLADLSAWQADVFVVVAFRMLPTEVWKMPTYGTFNLHASLLPDYRGAAPINWSIINGDKITGVSTFFIDEEIDTGNIIDQVEMAIGENETAGELHDRMMLVGGELVVKTLHTIFHKQVKTIAQADITNRPQRPAPKLFKENTRVNWKKSAQDIHNLVRGLSPYPCAWTLWKNEHGEQKQIKFFQTRLTGEIGKEDLSIESTKQAIYIHATGGKLEIVEFQFEGKRKMTTKDWLVGNKTAGWHIEN